MTAPYSSTPQGNRNPAIQRGASANIKIPWGEIARTGIDIIGKERQNRLNRKEAQKQRDFQERMSNTSYERAVKDMRIAGINPMLAYQQGGASSPGGAQARMEDVLGPALSSAMALMRMKKELKLLDEQTRVAHETAYMTQQTGNLRSTENTIASAGASMTTPYGVDFKVLTNEHLRAQIARTRQQTSQMRLSPFLTRLTGTDSPRHMADIFNRSQGALGKRYNRPYRFGNRLRNRR